MFKSWLRARLLIALGLAISAGALALGPVEPTPIPPDVGPQDDSDLFTDTEPDARAAALLERFGDYLSEDYKQGLLLSVLTQGALYGNLLPGGLAPRGTPQWRSLGPTDAKYQTNSVTLKVADSGRVRTVLQSADDPDTVYVLTAGGGLWKTQTFGQTNPRWDAKTDALLTTSGGSLAFGRSSNVLYVGLGDPFDGFPTLGGVIVKSVDGGDTWLPFANLPGAFSVNDIKVDSSGPVDVVLVATDAGLYRSTDAGATFAKVAAVPGQRIWSLAKTSAGWLATSAVYAVGSSAQGRMLYSVDGGATWGFIPNPGNGFFNAGRATLAVARPGESIVYALAANRDGYAQRDLFKSVDGGLSWSALGITSKTPSNPTGFQPDMNLLGQQGWYNQMILVDEADPARGTVYLGGQLSTAKTVDGGNSWTLISDWLPGIYSNLPYVHGDHHAATFVTLGGQRALVFGTDGGIFVSADGGASFSFEKNRGIVSFLAQSIAASTMNPQNLITGMQDTGTRARLGASGFFNQVRGGDGEGVGWSQANNARTLATVPGKIYSTPGLLPNTRGDWARFRLPSSTALFFTPVTTPTSAADPTGLVFLSALANGPIITFDGGLSWYYLARSGYKLPANFRVRDNWYVVGLDPTAATNNIAVGGTAGRVAVSTNGGATWSVRSLNTLVPGFQSSVDASTWTAGGVLYVTSEAPFAGAVHVVKSVDGGVSFQRADAGLPDAGVYQVVVDPRDASGNSLFAATYLGVYRSNDGGGSWARFGAGLPAVRTTGMWIAEDGSVLRVATYGRGVWEINP